MTSVLTSFSMTRRPIFLATVAVALTMPAIGWAQTKANVPRPPDKQAIAMENVKELLLLMDTNKNGKISKKEWMNYMSAEFDRLDTDKSGELDPKELLRSPIYVTHISSETQGK